MSNCTGRSKNKNKTQQGVFSSLFKMFYRTEIQSLPPDRVGNFP